MGAGAATWAGPSSSCRTAKSWQEPLLKWPYLTSPISLRHRQQKCMWQVMQTMWLQPMVFSIAWRQPGQRFTSRVVRARADAAAARALFSRRWRSSCRGASSSALCVLSTPTAVSAPPATSDVSSPSQRWPWDHEAPHSVQKQKLQATQIHMDAPWSASTDGCAHQLRGHQATSRILDKDLSSINLSYLRKSSDGKTASTSDGCSGILQVGSGQQISATSPLRASTRMSLSKQSSQMP
mmetsp:Transcript_123269/g.262862  ORF Transcript_123269/g.262862 Transcript_123269/m.262862 type:complete len:238 (-) Transcript_123269:89-802(-)